MNKDEKALTTEHSFEDADLTELHSFNLRERVSIEFAKRCPAPWISLLAFANGEFAPCCFTMLHGQNLQSYTTIDSAWNSDYMVRMRELISEERYREAGCLKSCVYLNGNSTPPYEPAVFTANINKEYYRTPYLSKILEDFLERRSIVTSRAAIISIVLFNHCNLRCVMCPQDHNDKSRLSYASLSTLLSEPEYLTSVSLVGGELFADKRFSKYFSAFPFHEGGYQNIVIFTNGMLLDQERLDDITTHIFPYLLFSIDGATPQTYNSIRIGSDFDLVMQNLKRTATHYRTHGYQERITWHYLVMKSSLQEIEIAYDICERLGITFEIEKVMGYFPQENFFDFPYILESALEVRAAITFLAKGALAEHPRTAPILACLKEVANKLAAIDGFLSLPPESAADSLTNVHFLRELLNACLYGHLRDQIALRLAEALPYVTRIPEKSHADFLILLTSIPAIAPNREKAVTHIKGLMPAWAEEGAFSSNSLAAISSILRSIYDVKSASVSNFIEIIDGITGLIAPDKSDLEKGRIVGAEAFGASLIRNNFKFGENGGIYEFLDRYLNISVLNWNAVTPSWSVLLYRLASWRENMKMTEKAASLFGRILDIPNIDIDLLPGCHYHLACLAIDCGDKEAARGHCLKCLTINGAHKAARELITCLTA